MALRAKKAELIKPRKPRILLFGPPKVGKTSMLLNAPGLYLADSEGGATQSKYRKKMIEKGALYLSKEEGAGELSSLTRELRALAVEKHDRLVLGVDSYSKLWNDEITQSQARIFSNPENADKPTFGREKKDAIRESRDRKSTRLNSSHRL